MTERAQEVFEDGDFQFDVLRNKGITLGQLGEYDKAIDVFNELIFSANPEQRIKAHVNLVWVYITLYKKDKEQLYLKNAEKHSDKVFELKESYVWMIEYIRCS